jgi:hypothetical protein
MFFAISKPENLISTYKKHCIHVEMASSNSPEFLSLVKKMPDFYNRFRQVKNIYIEGCLNLLSFISSL